MEELQASMQQMLKNFGEMRVEVKSMTNEMQAFRQQLDDFGEDMDRVKRRVNEMEKSATQVRVEIPQASKGVATARMTNHGPPLLDTSLHSTGTAVFTTTPSSPKDAVDTTSAGDFVVRPRRHDFPRFSGETPLLWVDLCPTYFEMYHVPEHH
jgi:hypothetical protein